MTSKGKHAERGLGSFYRDLVLMILGILLVGTAVFLILFLVADNPDETTTTAAAAPPTTVTSTTEAATTSIGTTSSSATSTSSTSTTVPVRPPEEVRVVVLNSIGVAGAAARLTGTLEDAGYQTLQADDYQPEQDPSRIWYREGFSAEASQLLDFVHDAVVEPLPDETLEPGADVVVILGVGYEE